MAVMSGLTSLIEAGKYKVPVKVEALGYEQGFDAIEQGLDKLQMKIVSGVKYVVSF